MSELLDEFARSLATSMPRRRALRVLGAAVVGIWAGRAATSARGAPGRQTHTCDTNVRTLGWKYCTPATERCFPTCCPRERVCSVGPSPNGCPILVSCCNPCNPRGSRPTPDGSCGPGPVSPDCAPKTCGPDITRALDDAMGRVRSEFSGCSTLERYDACIGLTTLPGAAISWDIKELGPGGRESFTRQYPGCGTCGNSVQVGNDCHYAGSVNYAVYGVMMRLCHDYLSREESSIADWFSREEMLELVYIHKNQSGTQAANFQASNEWALAGYQSGSLRPTPPGDRSDCTKRCSKAYSGPGLTVRWLPKVIRPR